MTLATIPLSRHDTWQSIDYATYYLSLGLRVVRVYPNAKNPVGGYKDAWTDSPEVAEQWWTDDPDYGVGIVVPPGIVCIDVDPQHDGDIAHLIAEVGELPETFTIQTGRHHPDGLHFYFRIDPSIAKCEVKLFGQEMDVRHANSVPYLVAAPSLHESTGWPYRIHNDSPIADAPEALVKFISKAEGKPYRRPPRRPVTGSLKRASDLGGGLDGLILTRAVEAILAAQEGERNHTLNAQAYVVGMAGIPMDEAEAALHEAYDAIGGDGSFYATFRSGYSKGEALSGSERCEVSGSTRTSTNPLVDVSHKANEEVSERYEVSLAYMTPKSHTFTESVGVKWIKGLEYVWGDKSQKQGALDLARLIAPKANEDGSVAFSLTHFPFSKATVQGRVATLVNSGWLSRRADDNTKGGRGHKKVYDIVQKYAVTTPSTGFAYNTQQAVTAQGIRDFVLDKRLHNGIQTLRIHGRAGTGKTTLLARELQALSEEHGITYLVLTPTNKAAAVLRTKGIEAKTIHSALTFKSGGRYVLDNRRREVVEQYDVVVVDESSMCGEQQHAAFVYAAAKRVIAIGDPNQLLPVDESGRDVPIWSVPGTHDFLLTESVRFSDGSEIARLGNGLCDGVPFKILLEDSSAMILDPEQAYDDWAKWDTVITYRNEDRWLYTEKIRGGLHPPVPGDVIQTLSNDVPEGIYNRKVWEVVSNDGAVTHGFSKRTHYLLTVKDNEGATRSLRVFTRGFESLEGEVDQWDKDRGPYESMGRRRIYPAMWATTHTVHSAQSAEWGKVLYIIRANDLPYLQHGNMENGSHGMAYTAITRAMNEVGVLVV